jgi:hypothetical protein
MIGLLPVTMAAGDAVQEQSADHWQRAPLDGREIAIYQVPSASQSRPGICVRC